MRREKPFFVHLYTKAFDTHRSGSLGGCRESVFFGQYVLASCGEHSIRHIEGGSGAYCHAALPIFVRRMMYDLDTEREHALNDFSVGVLPLYAR